MARGETHGLNMVIALVVALVIVLVTVFVVSHYLSDTTEKETNTTTENIDRGSCIAKCEACKSGIAEACSEECGCPTPTS